MFLADGTNARIQSSTADRIQVVALDVNRAGVTGATVLLSIKRKDTGYWWSGTGWQSAFVTVAMTALDATNRPGEYYYDFPAQVGAMVLSCRATSATAGVTNDPWWGELIVGGYLDYLDESIASRSADADTAKILARTGPTQDSDIKRIRSLVGVIYNRTK
jgi:hypothetical protein